MRSDKLPDSSIRAIVAAIDPGLKTLAHEGESAYRDRFESVYRRTSARVNEQFSPGAGAVTASVRRLGRRRGPTSLYSWLCPL